MTTVRDLGGNNHVDLALDRAIRRGDVSGPRMLAAGKVITSTGGHIHYWGREADGPDEVRKAVREQCKAGARVIKLMLSGGAANADGDAPRMQLQEDEIRAAVVAASEAGCSVAAHAHPARAIRVAAESGVRSVEHGAGLDDDGIEALVAHGVWLVPTQAVYEHMARDVDGAAASQAARIRDAKLPSLRRAIQAGVKLGVGTDSGRHFSHAEIVAELQGLADAGLSNEQVLLAATRGNADLLGLFEEIGTIEVDKRADLVLVGSSPLADLGHLRDIRVVVQHGRALRNVCLAVASSNALSRYGARWR